MSTAPASSATDEPGRVPASVGQRLLWVLEQFRGADGAANCPIVLRLRGPLDEELLAAGLERLTARHEALRTTFTGRGRRLTQVVNSPRPVAVRHVDRSQAEDREATVAGEVLDEIRRPIDATVWPVRATLWRLDPQDHTLCLNMHHLVTDGWSCGLVLRDLAALARGAEEVASLPTVGWQYRQFSTWQQEWLDDDRSRPDRDYWRRHLQGAPLPAIPLGARPSDSARLDNASLTADLEPDLIERLQGVARRLRTTFPSVMLGAYYVVLRRTTGQQDLAVASFLSNRTQPHVQQTVGLLANMVVLRSQLHHARTLDEVIRVTHATVMDAFVHQGLPYQLLPADTIGQRGDRRPDDVVFQMVPHPTGRYQVAGAEAEAVVVETLGTRFECELQLYPTGKGLRVVLFFNRSRLDDGAAKGLLEEFVSVVRSAGAPV